MNITLTDHQAAQLLYELTNQDQDDDGAAERLADHLGYGSTDLPYSVGVTSSCERLARFADAVLAAQFINTLPGHEAGIYYLDGPET